MKSDNNVLNKSITVVLPNAHLREEDKTEDSHLM